MKVLGWDISFKRTEKRGFQIPSWYPSFGSSTTFGAQVSDTTVLAIATWWRGIQIYSNTIGGLPKGLYRKTDKGYERVMDNPALKLINGMTSENMDSYSWHKAMVSNLINHGNAYSIILRDGNAQPTKLMIVPSEKVTVKKWMDDTIFYQIDGLDDLVPFEDMYHLKGITYDGYYGFSPLYAQRVNLGQALASSEWAKDVYENGTRLRGYIKVPGTLKPESVKNLRETWREKYSGASGNDTAILDNGMEFVPLQMTPSDVQFIETQRYNKSEIALVLGLPLHMVNETDGSTYNNVEQQYRGFVSYSLLNYVHSFEQENKKLLTDKQVADGWKWKYNVNGLLRGNTVDRAAYYTEMNKIGVLSANEIRQLEDFNPYEGGDKYFIQGNNMIPVEDAGKGDNNDGEGNT